MKNVGLAVAMVAVAGCGVNEAEVTEGSDLLGEQNGELSTTSRTYVTFTHDMRKCASPMCGGYFVTDVNRLNPAPRYVSAIDFSKTGLDDAAVEKALGGATATVLRGKLGAEEPAFHTRPFIVTDAWRGMPGVTEATGDSFFLVDAVNVQCIKAPCPTMKATRLNAGGATMIHQTSVADAALMGVDRSWLTRRVEQNDAIVSGHFTQGALVSGTHEKVLTASQVYLKLPEAPGPCPLYKMAPCPSGQVRPSTRTADRCVLPTGACIPQTVCTQFPIACAADYTRQTWTVAGKACPAFACDPDFSL